MPASTNANPITESSILANYLLTPSPLPTILPFSNFLALVPKPYCTDPSYRSAIRRLYRDLQFQRDITIDQVRESIERESTVQAPIWKARLAKQLAIEEGEADEDARPRKRRRQGRSDDSEPEDELSSSDDEFSNPVLIAAQQTMYHHPLSSHPAAHVLPLSGEMLDRQVRVSARSAYHTKASLLREMEAASQSLDDEIAELEAECAMMSDSITETVGGLSDLRYGKRQSDDEIDGEPYKDVVEAIQQFRGVIRDCAKT